MATVLMPSNFEKDSFACIHELVETFPGMPLRVLFFHPFGLSSSITDLLMLSRRNKEETLVSFDFYKGCLSMEQEYQQIKGVNWTCFYGTTLVAFKNFLKANSVDFIVSPGNYEYKAIAKMSQDPTLFLKKCALPVISLTPLELA